MHYVMKLLVCAYLCASVGMSDFAALVLRAPPRSTPRLKPSAPLFCAPLNGNHCLYNHEREELSTRLGIRELQQRQDGVWDAPHSYYTFSPAPGWRFICLDGYDVSILGWPAGEWKDGGMLFGGGGQGSKPRLGRIGV